MKLGLVHDDGHGCLVNLHVEINVRTVHWHTDGLRKHLYGPWAHPQKKCAAVKALLVAIAKKVDVRKVRRWKKSLERYGWVDKDEVSVDPPRKPLSARNHSKQA